MSGTGEASPILVALRAGELAGATRLDLACGLTEFPKEVFELADTLEVLNLSGNRLSELPADLPRLHRLKILFCSDNAFTHMPAVLGACDQLEMVGFKANRIATVDPEAFPPCLRWLILTDNQLAELPGSIGRCTALQKLMLAGNQLLTLPDEMAGCVNLELIRLAANRFQTFPDWLFGLPKLSWLGLGGNPWEEIRPTVAMTEVDWAELEIGDLLGEGASGVIRQAQHMVGGTVLMAVKIFKGEMTSDGLPASEMAACLGAGIHPNLIGVAAKITGHPDGLNGLLMPLVDPDFTNLAGPPSLASCTRDVYHEDSQFPAAEVAKSARDLASVGAHLHARRILHGDFYGHNILRNSAGHCLLGDFGAASLYPEGAAVEALEVRAFGCLLEELLERQLGGVPAAWWSLQRRCVSTSVRERPLFSTIVAEIDALDGTARDFR